MLQETARLPVLIGLVRGLTGLPRARFFDKETMRGEVFTVFHLCSEQIAKITEDDATWPEVSPSCRFAEGRGHLDER